MELSRSARGLLSARPAARPSRELRLRSDLVAERGRVRRLRLRRVANVAVVEAADEGQGNDAAVLGWLDSARIGGIFLERKVRPRAVVVAEVAAQTTTEVFLVEDDHVVEPFTRRRNSPP